MDLKPFDSVIYRPRHATGRGWDPEACLYNGEERGIVKSVHDTHAFVWFTSGGTAARCELRDLHEDTREAREARGPSLLMANLLFRDPR